MVTHAQPSIDWAHRWLKGRITSTFKIGDNGPRIKALQIYLSSKGYDPGKADGVWGRNTQLAYSQWAKDQGFEAGSDDRSAVRATPKAFTYIRREIKTPTPRAKPVQPPLPPSRGIGAGISSGDVLPELAGRGPDVSFGPGGGFSAPPPPPMPPPLPPMSGIGTPPIPPSTGAGPMAAMRAAAPPPPPLPPMSGIGAPPMPPPVAASVLPPRPPIDPNRPAVPDMVPPLPAVAGGSAGVGPMPGGMPGIGGLLPPQTPGEQMNRPDMMPQPPPPTDPNRPSAGDADALRAALMGPGKPPGMTYEQMIQLLAQAGAGG